MLLLHNISVEQQRWISVGQYVATFTLKDAFPMLHRAWLNIRPETFNRCWTSADDHSFDDVALTFGRSAATPLQVEEDRMLLLELQWLSHDLGLEVTDEDLARWVRSVAAEASASPEQVYVKPEPTEENGNATSNDLSLIHI